MKKEKSSFKTVAALGAFTLAGIHLINYTVSSSATVKNILNPQFGKTYHWKMGNIYYRQQGTGSPLLLIHDLNPLSSGFEWNTIEYELAKRHTVYSVDLLGCGRSDKPGITYTNYLYVQLLSDFIRDVIKDKTDVLATGISSSFVIMTSYQDSSLIGKITMINPESLKKLQQIPTTKSKVLFSMMSVPILGTFLYHMKVSKQNVEYIITENYFYNPFLVNQKCIDAYYEAAHRSFGKGKFLQASLEGFYLNVDIRRALQAVDNEIVIIYGNKGRFAKEIAESYQKINPSITLSPISNTKFLPQLESPLEVLSLLNSDC